MSEVVMKLVTALHQHPAFCLLVAFGVIGSTLYSEYAYAPAKDVASFERRLDRVQTEVVGIKSTIERSSLEQRVHALESEIFALERVIADGEPRDIDFQRLSRLRSDLGTAERTLARLH